MSCLKRFVLTASKCGMVMFSVSVCASGCLSVCNALTFDSLHLEFIFGMQVQLQNISAKFISQGHQINVKLTGAKSVSVYPVRVFAFERQSC